MRGARGIEPEFSRGQYSHAVIGRHGELLLAAAASLRKAPARSSAIIVSLVAILSPFVTALAVSEGVKNQYGSVLTQGADVYVARDNYGSNAPIELALAKQFQDMSGVTAVVPRVIGRTYVKGKFMAVLGISHERIPPSIELVQGRKPNARGDVIVGKTAAEYLNLEIGDRFSLKMKPEQVFEIVGLFRSPFTIWNADLIVMRFDDASALFGMKEKATDLMIFTRPGYQQIVDAILRMSDDERQKDQSPLRAQTKQIISRYSHRGFNIKAGVFVGFYTVVLAMGIPAVGVISGFGHRERQREIGVIKALGWQTQDVLEMAALENVILSLLSIPFIVLVAVIWIHVFNGSGIARFFIADFDILVPFQVPSRLFPVPCVLGALLAVVLTTVGSIYSTWRTAIVPPIVAMKL